MANFQKFPPLVNELLLFYLVVLHFGQFVELSPLGLEFDKNTIMASVVDTKLSKCTQTPRKS